MKVGKAGKAGPHAAYISRAGQYASRLEHGEKLEATGVGNMPKWAGNPLELWQAADASERANGTTYREMEIALPRELTPDQRAELVREFVAQEIGDRHAYQWAIHSPVAADGKEQPHVHLMFSERQRDGVERDPAQYFKRYNAKAPEKGGARKGYGPHAGQTLSAAERAADLKALRGRWQEVANRHLERAGVGVSIDMRSYAERGLRTVPEAKQLPSAWRGAGRAKVLEFRAARVELRQAVDQVRQAVPNAAAAVIDLEQARQKAAERAKLGQLAAVPEPQRLAALDHAVRSLPENQRRSAAAMLNKAPPSVAVMLPAVQWHQAIAKERESHLAEQLAAATEVVADHRNNALNPHIAREPTLFGKARWQQTHDALMATDRENITRYERMKRGEFTPAELALADQEAERRAGEKQPKLAELGKAAQQQIREAVSRGHEADAQRRSVELQRQLEQQRQKDPGRGYGGPEL